MHANNFHILMRPDRGGPEFLLDQGGGDVTELFEDAGHSGEARSLLKKLKIGVVKDKVRKHNLCFWSCIKLLTIP